MKLKNKKTGEIVELLRKPSFVKRNDGYLQSEVNTFNSLAELNEEWEDYEEPKEHYFITEYGEVFSLNEYEGFNNVANPEDYKQIGNYFDTQEEAEKAVEKLKAWKRLKGHNLRIERGQRIFVNADNKLTSQKPLFVVDTYEEVEDDLDLLFGGEDE